MDWNGMDTEHPEWKMAGMEGRKDLKMEDLEWMPEMDLDLIGTQPDSAKWTLMDGWGQQHRTLDWKSPFEWNGWIGLNNGMDLE